MAASSPVSDLAQSYGAPTGPRMGTAPTPTQSGVPIVAEVRSLSSPSSAPVSASIPVTVSTAISSKRSASPLGGGGGVGATTALVPPVAGARQLAKLKRFLTSLLQFGHDMPSEAGDKTEELVVKLVVRALVSCIFDFNARFRERKRGARLFFSL